MRAALAFQSFRPFSRFVVLLLFLCFWLWLAERFFNAPTTDFNPQYEGGFAAIAEQLAAALYTPAWFIWELSLSGWRARVPTLDRGLLFLLCTLQIWPVFVLAVYPWHRLSSTLRRAILTYCGFCLLAVVPGFIILHRAWDRIFGA